MDKIGKGIPMNALRLLAIVSSIMFATLSSVAHSAFITHHYEGQPFDNSLTPPPPPPGVDRITGFISLDLSTVDTETALTDVEAYVGNFSFTDGFQTLSSVTGATIDDAFVKTDSSGNIEEWLFDIQDFRFGSALNTSCDPLDTDGSADTSRGPSDPTTGSPGYFVFVDNDTTQCGGAWTKADAGVPLPATIWLVGVVLGMSRFLQKKKATV